MKNQLRHIMLMAVAVASVHVAASAASAPFLEDTVYFYESWEQVFSDSPVIAVTPLVYTATPYELYFDTGNERFNSSVEDEFIAATMGDSIWLINSNYVKQNFNGDAKKLDGYVPFYFNDKVAFAVYAGVNDNMSLKNILFGSDESNMDYSNAVSYYYFDFMGRKVLKVNPSVLSELLEDYHDLQMRYEGMKNYKKKEIIEDYFFKYIDRASQDVLRPNILDLVE